MTGVRVGFAGLTHLGICSATATAARGFETLGYDADAGLVAKLAAGEPPILEPDLRETMAANAQRLRFTADIAQLRDCHVIYLALDVRTDDAGNSDLAPLRDLIGKVAQVARPQATIVVLSQVPPGFTRGYAATDGRFIYQVETLIFGRAMERALRPERFIVGCADSSAPLPVAYAELLRSFGCPILPMRFESAELAKISINMCLVASVGVANTMAELCEGVGADWSEIVPALKLDARIGPKSYLAPGLGIAGGNLERDLSTVVRLSGEHGTDCGIVKAWIANSAHRRDWVLRRLAETVLDKPGEPIIGVLGLAYKEDTASTKNSPSLALIRNLRPVRLQAYDPVVKVDTAWHPNLAAASSALAACDGAAAVVVMTPWKQFRELDPAAIARRMSGKVMIDPYRVLDPAACRAAGLAYHTLGRPAEAA